MKKFNSSKNIIIAITLVIAIVALVSLSSNQRNEAKDVGIMQSVTNDVGAGLDKLVSFPIKGIESGLRSVSNLLSTYDENDRLKKRLDGYASLQSENEIYKKENEALKKQLNLEATLSSFERINATVISRSPDTWQNILIIDQGKNNGVEVNMPVLGSGGLVGRVIVANPSSAKVELLTSTNKNSNHFPIMIKSANGDNAYGLLSEYDDEEEAFIVTQLTTLKDLKEGDKVSTSGLGGASPKGLLIGEVKKIKETNFGLDKEVYVTPSTSMYDIPVVTVVKRLAESDGE